LIFLSKISSNLVAQDGYLIKHNILRTLSCCGGRQRLLLQKSQSLHTHINLRRLTLAAEPTNFPLIQQLKDLKLI